MSIMRYKLNWLCFSGPEEGGEKELPLLLGEGGDSGELQPGKSLVFAAMELLVFLLVRHLPQINAKASDSPSHVPIKPQQLSEHSNRLLAVTVGILAELPSLCSPAGTHTHCLSITCYTLL